jgi:hypothetical protein
LEFIILPILWGMLTFFQVKLKSYSDRQFTQFNNTYFFRNSYFSGCENLYEKIVETNVEKLRYDFIITVLVYGWIINVNKVYQSITIIIHYTTI